jgi:hypothetical protein
LSGFEADGKLETCGDKGGELGVKPPPVPTEADVADLADRASIPALTAR